MERTEIIETSRAGIKKIIEWIRFQRWMCCGSIFLLLSIAVWAWNEYRLVIPTEVQFISGLLGGVVVIMLVNQISTINTSIKLLQREEALHDIRLDLISSVESVLREVLEKHLPEFRSLQTHLAVGEDLLHGVEQVSKRYADFQHLLAKEMPGLQLAEAINALVEASSEKHGVEVSVTSLAEFLERREVKS